MVVENLYRNAAADIETDFMIDEQLIVNLFERIYNREFDPKNEIDLAVLDAVRRVFDNAVDQGFGKKDAEDTNYAFYEELRYNNAVFSAFKVHRMQNDMAAQLLDADGKLKPFEKWREDVASIADHQMGSWLRTEYNMSIRRALLAADWKRFEKRADVLPNIRWEPSTSVHPGEDHQIFWNVVQPIYSAFWTQHRPGDRWGCKCGLSQTDEPPTSDDEMPIPMLGDTPSPGLDNNPAYDAKLFSDTHPYIAEAYKGAAKAVKQALKDIYPDYAQVGTVPTNYKVRAKELRKIAQQTLAGKVLKNEGFGREIHVSMRGIKEYLNQPHKHYAYKNELLLKMPEIMRQAEYMGSVPNFKDVAGVKQSHLFEIRIQGDESWIVVREMKGGQIELYSISDSPRILERIKK